MNRCTFLRIIFGLLIALTCFTCIQRQAALASVRFVSGEGRFYARADDSLALIKKQLLASAFHNIINQELQAMKLDHELFWNKFEINFEKYFSNFQDKLKKKYGIENNNSNISSAKRKSYEKALRNKRLHLKSKFGRLSRAIQSYSIKKMGRSPKIKNARYLNLSAKVNRKILSEIYQEFTREWQQIRQFDKLYLSTNFTLKNLNWNDLGVVQKSDFVVVVQNHWKKWPAENLKGYLSRVVVAEEEILNQLREYLKIPEHASESIILASSKKATETKSPLSDPLANSLWLNISIRISKGSEDSLTRLRSYLIEGEFVLVDLKTSFPILHFDFPTEEHRLSYNIPQELSSALASIIYRRPMAHFAKIPNLLGHLAQNPSKIRLEVENIRSVEDLLQIKELLSQKGISSGFTPKILSYGRKKGEISLVFHGGADVLVGILRRLNHEQVGRHAYITFPHKERPFLMFLKHSSKGTTAKAKERP